MYDRDYLTRNIRPVDVWQCGDYAESTDMTAEQFCAGFNRVLDWIRANAPVDGSHRIAWDAIHSAKGAWDTYCGNQGDVHQTIESVSHEWMLAACGQVLIETMPDHLRGSHRAARNWGVWPYNGAERRWVDPDDASAIMRADPDNYAHVVWGSPVEAEHD